MERAESLGTMRQVFLNWAVTAARRRWERSQCDPIERQRRAFRARMAACAATVFGRDHGLRAETSYESFRRQVPLRDYEQLRPYLERIEAGQSDVLCPGRPKYWGRTGGTTAARNKWIPIFDAAIAQSRKTFVSGLLLHLFEHPNSSVARAFWSKKILFLGSCSRLDEHSGLPAGFMSSVMAREMPRLMRRVLLPGTQVDAFAEWSDKIDAIWELTRRESISIAAGMPPWLTAFFRTVVERSGRPVLDVWPELSFIIHSGVAMDSYRAEIQRLLGPRHAQVSFKNGYGATEGNFAVQARDADTDLTLITDEVFYEFVPLEAYLEGHAAIAETRIPLEHVQPGVEYVLVLTTPGGLTGYVIGDTVTFTRVPGDADRDRAYRFRISGRTTQFLNHAGEKVTTAQLTHAIAAAADRLGISVTEFTLFPVDTGTAQSGFVPGHEWIVELANDAPSLARARELAVAIDSELARANPLYELRRRSWFGDTPLLAAPRFTFVSPGTYAAWQKRRQREGGHFKVPRICESASWRSELSMETSARIDLAEQESQGALERRRISKSNHRGVTP